MDPFHREKFARVFRLLAEILERGPEAHAEEGHLSYRLGDLTRRLFVGPRIDPPDELLEQAGRALRSNDAGEHQAMARRLLSHAEFLEGNSLEGDENVW